MNSKLILIPTKDMSRESWLAYRQNGLGASEIGTVLGLNEYKSSIELFYEKVGLKPVYSLENIAMFMGTEQESFIARLWEYWDGTVEGMIANYRAGTKVRRCQRVNAYVTNPAYPWLFVSLDRKINKTVTMPEGTLEIKTISGWESNKWEGGIPPAHLVQVQTQILVCDFTHGELATQKDGRQYDVYQFTENKNIQNVIVERTKIFWDRVLEARGLLTQRYEADLAFNHKRVREINARLDEIEPEPDGTVAYTDYLREKYKAPMAGLVMGSPNDYEVAKLHKAAIEKKSALEKEITLYSNQLKKRINDMTTLDFGEKGKVIWDGNPRKFFNRLK